MPGNQIAAGHLAVQVNRGEGSDLAFSDLMPGEQRSGDQTVTGDLTGVATADLTLTLRAADPGLLDDEMSLTIWYGDPSPIDGIEALDDTCASSGGYSHSVRYAHLTDLAQGQTVALGTLTGDRDALCVRFQMSLAATADNRVQGANADISLDYTLTQTPVGTR